MPGLPSSPDVPPEVAELVALLSDVDRARSVYCLRDDRSEAMDTVKVIGDGAGGYLGIYHTGTGQGFDVHLATSVDLMTWRHRVRLDTQASQPTVAALPADGFLTAVEAGGGHGRPAWLRFRRYPDLARLLAADPDATFDAPHTLTPRHRLAEGTPEHLHRPLSVHCGRRVPLPPSPVPVAGRGGPAFPRDDARVPAVERLARTEGGRGRGGARCARATSAGGTSSRGGATGTASWRGSCAGGAGSPGACSSTTGRPARPIPVPVRTRRGSASFGNPALTLLTAPTAEPAMVVTAYLFPAGAAPGEAGPLLYYRILDRPATAA